MGQTRSDQKMYYGWSTFKEEALDQASAMQVPAEIPKLSAL